VRQLFVRVQCTVQSETVIGLRTVHGEANTINWCMYSVQCSETVIGMCTGYSTVKMLLVCVQCTMQ